METENNETPNNLDTSLTNLSLCEVSQSRDNTTTNEDDKAELAAISTKKKLAIPMKVLPSINVPEMIVLCLDTYVDPEYTSFKLGDGSEYAPLYMLKRTIEIFVQNKSFIDAQHEFALLTLNSGKVRWVQDFTNNPKDLINSLDRVTESETQEKEFDLSVVLDAVWEMVTVPKPMKNLSIPPSCVVRLIMLYSRSFCSTVLKKDFTELLSNPYFTIDVVMTHEEQNEDSKCQAIFDVLQQMDEKGFSYNFAVGRNPTVLHDAMAKLLAHPLQRPLQTQACYKAFIIDKDE